MASSSHKKKRFREPSVTKNRVLENLFAGDEETIITIMHEMSRKQINIPKVLEFSCMKTFPRKDRIVYPDLVKVFYTNLSLKRRNQVSSIKGIKLLITNKV